MFIDFSDTSYSLCTQHTKMFTQYPLRKIKRKLLQAVLISLTLILLLSVYNTDYYPNLHFKTQPYEDVSCHFVNEGDALPSIDKRFFPPSNSIYFHETSCKGRLDSIQACSIESASRTHPKWEIHVLFSSPLNKLNLGDINMELLRFMKNVYVSRVKLLEYAKDTPFEELVSEGALNRTRWPISATSEVLKVLTLYKWGGVYLDLDVLVLKPLEGLGRNWAARKDDLSVASAALAFSRDSVGTFVADAVVRTLSKSYRGNFWNHQKGEALITNALKEICSTDDVMEMNAEKCLGFEVYPPAFLYPLDPDIPQQFFEPGLLNISKDSYMYHLWNKQTHNLKNHKDSSFMKLAKRYCPIVYDTYRDKFGI